MSSPSQPGAECSASGAGAQCCAVCGLCCNGVLFADVKLQRREDHAKLSALGLALRPHGQVYKFTQPCSCLQGTLCRVYDSRPASCRAFECQLLKQVIAGKRSVETALRLIRRTRTEVAKVNGLLRSLGERDEEIPLSSRCERIIAAPLDLSGSRKVLNERARLMRAIHGLTELLRHFVGEPAK